MKKLLGLVLSVALLPGCFTATGAAIGSQVQYDKTPAEKQSSSNAVAVGAGIGLAADVVLAVVVASAVLSSAQGGNFYPYGEPGQGD